MARTRTKYSIFCKNKPSQHIGFGAVYLSDNQIWVLAKGKKYLNGRFRYIYNGKEGTAGQYHWKDFTGYSYAEMEDEIRSMNWSVLTSRHPRKKAQVVQEIRSNFIPWRPVGRMATFVRAEPVGGAETFVMAEPNGQIEPLEMAYTTAARERDLREDQPTTQTDEGLPVVDIEYEPTGN